jgi:hypothetical protein
MIESAIPNEGLGMYTARDIDQYKTLFSGDVVIQVDDFELNMKLRRWYHKQNDINEPDWLMDSYYWNPQVTLGMRKPMT